MKCHINLHQGHNIYFVTKTIQRLMLLTYRKCIRPVKVLHKYRKTSNTSLVSYSRVSNTSRRSKSDVLIEAGSQIKAGYTT